MTSRPGARSPARLHCVARPEGGVRQIARLDPLDARDYDRAVAPLVSRIEADLGPTVVANRALRRGGVATTALEDWRGPRQAWVRSIARWASTGRPLVVADVRSCYASISAEVVGSVLGPAAEPVLELLRGFAEHGVPGLPIGPRPSAILANVVLSPIDRALARAGLRHLRWVDDVVVFPSTSAEATRALHVLRVSTDRLGLELHDAKTGLVDARSTMALSPAARAPSS